MEIWIGEDSNRFQIPVLPASFSFNNSIITNDTHINEFGQITLFGGKALSTLTWSCFFPNQRYSFVTTNNLKNTYEYVELFKRIQHKGTPTRVLITETDINMNFFIEGFSYQEQDGSGDVYYSLNLKEYRKPEIYYSEASTSTTNNTAPVATRSTPPTSTNKTHTVKNGDTLWGLAVKYYNNGSQYIKIYDANKDKVKNPNVIKVGWELIIP